MFIEAVRRYTETVPAHQKGWLAGLRDRFVGRALTLMHTRPAYPWTVDGLGHEVGLSRSALAERFAGLLGQPPMQYLAHWRLQVGRARAAKREPVARGRGGGGRLRIGSGVQSRVQARIRHAARHVAPHRAAGRGSRGPSLVPSALFADLRAGQPATISGGEVTAARFRSPAAPRVHAPRAGRSTGFLAVSPCARRSGPQQGVSAARAAPPPPASGG